MDDLISRRKAIDTTWFDPYYTDPLNVLTEVRDRLEVLPSAQPEPRWIPVTERLPFTEYGESNDVLCCMENGLMKVLYFNGGNWCYPTGESYCGIVHETGWHNKVIAWMPLPKPWKEVEE